MRAVLTKIEIDRLRYFLEGTDLWKAGLEGYQIGNFKEKNGRVLRRRYLDYYRKKGRR